MDFFVLPREEAAFQALLDDVIGNDRAVTFYCGESDYQAWREWLDHPHAPPGHKMSLKIDPGVAPGCLLVEDT